MVSNVLVANRGEIACRILRACSEAGLSSIAIYADNDVNCQVAAPTNPVVVYENSTPTSNTLTEYKTFIKIPKTKFPYIQLTGFNYEAVAIGVEH